VANKKRERGEHYPVNHVADELGVDRNTLKRRLEEIGIRPNGSGITFREAYSALSNRREEEEESRRTKRALRESAELDAARQKSQLVLRRNHESIVTDIAVQTRGIIERASYIPMDSRKKLTKELAGIRVELAKPAE
jgi:hypothetical protein